MFKLRLAEYINSNMQERNWTYRDLSGKSGVPDSSIHSYAQGRVTTPNEDNLIRIAAAFGDGPDVIQEMRREALPSTVQENKLLAESADKERMEAFASLMRKNMLSVMEEYRTAAAEQQTEIIRHADEHVEIERRRFKARADEVLRQCTAEIAKNESICNEKIAMTEKHVRELLTLKDEQIKKADAENEKVRAYLRVVVRNLTVALIAVAVFAVVGLACLGGYAFYAYQTFDLKDPTRGMYRGGASIGPIVLTLLVVGAVGAIAFFIFLFFNARKKKG